MLNNMNTIEKSSSGISLIPIESKLLYDRKIFIQGEITLASACEFVKALMILSKDKSSPIDVFINSPGGECSAGLMIYDVIQSIKDQVNLHCIGMAASMAAIIMACGKKGQRFILPHSKMMIHEPLISDGIGGSATSIQRMAISVVETKNLTIDLLAENTGKSKKDIEAAISYDNYMNAQECISFGLCDKIELTFL